MIGCRNCEQVTSGDCGAHGAIHPTALLAAEALRDALEIEVARLTAELAAERDKRAAAEARELRLREALAYVERKLTDPETEAELADACQRAQTALAQPADDSALRAHVAAAVERVVEAVQQAVSGPTGIGAGVPMLREVASRTVWQFGQSVLAAAQEAARKETT